MKEFFKKRWVYHSLVWFAGYLFFLINAIGDESSLLITHVEIFSNLSLIAFVTYAGFYAKEILFDKRKYVLYVLAIICIVASGAFAFELLRKWEFININNLAQDIQNLFFILLFSTGLQYLKRGIINQYQLQELRAKSLETELHALKAQINPHFLFNTLNNIYGTNQVNPENGSEMILELADVMRYHLTFSKKNLVSLEDEIQLLQSYIKLEKLRLSNNCDLILDVEDVEDTLMVSPLLLLPFVENAFKHGTHPINPCFIHLKITTSGTQLWFNLKNSVIKNRKVVKTNIGLDNTTRRLELIYPEKHVLNITSDDSIYEVDLKIDL